MNRKRERERERGGERMYIVLMNEPDNSDAGDK